jgi:hypothetical protein
MAHSPPIKKSKTNLRCRRDQRSLRATTAPFRLSLVAFLRSRSSRLSGAQVRRRFRCELGSGSPLLPPSLSSPLRNRFASFANIATETAADATAQIGDIETYSSVVICPMLRKDHEKRHTERPPSWRRHSAASSCSRLQSPRRALSR